MHSKTLEDCVDKFFQQEVIEPKGSYYCSTCSKIVGDAYKKFSLEEIPLIICIQLKLFKNTGGKINKDIQWTESIELGKYTSIYDDYSEKLGVPYKLFAMVAHYGAEEKTGHYKTFVSNDEWFTLNDEQVLHGLNLGEGTPYLLFFERVGCKEDESVIMECGSDVVRPNKQEYIRLTASCIEWLKSNQGDVLLGREAPIEVQRIYTELLI